MIEVMESFAWVDETSRSLRKGSIVYWLGSVFYQTTWSQYSSFVEFSTSTLRPRDVDFYVPSYVGVGVDSRQVQYNNAMAVEFINKHLAPLMVMAADGR